jgi:hypothetical protein
MSNQLDCTVHSMGQWVDDCWYWELSWRHQLFVWEEDLVHQLMRMLSRVQLDSTEDSWVSTIGDDGNYTVKAGYTFLSLNFLPTANLTVDECRSMKHIWESLAPQKVIVFAWQLLHQRLPTRVNLLKRRAFAQNSFVHCVHCREVMESEAHLFISCSFSIRVWQLIHVWLGLYTVVPGSILCIL